MAGRLAMLAAALLLGLPSGAGGDHPSQGVQTLEGVPAVTVVVGEVGPRLREQGLDREAVRRTVRSELEDADIPTEPGENAARLHVRLDSRRASRRFLALTIGLELRQHVRLDRDPQRIISATTWRNGAVAPVKAASSTAVSGRVASFVSRTFIPDFLAANSD